MEKISQEIMFSSEPELTTSEHSESLKVRETLLLQRIMHIPNRTRLWIYLTLGSIESDIDINRIEIVNAASHLPRSVNEAYEKVREPEKAKRILLIIVIAALPLNVREMAVAIAIREDHRSYSDFDLKSEDQYSESLQDACELFVRIIGRARAQVSRRTSPSSLSPPILDFQRC